MNAGLTVALRGDITVTSELLTGATLRLRLWPIIGLVTRRYLSGALQRPFPNHTRQKSVKTCRLEYLWSG
jgi:hypothetical protein